MKRILTTVITFCILSMIYSCSKEKPTENKGLIGKWQLTEYYGGYVNGGDFTWHLIPKENSHTLEFAPDGQYHKIENSGGALQQCSGTYQLLADSKVEVTSNCNTVNEILKFSTLTNTNLIIDRSGIEGVIRYKYSATTSYIIGK